MLWKLIGILDLTFNFELLQSYLQRPLTAFNHWIDEMSTLIFVLVILLYVYVTSQLQVDSVWYLVQLW
jgi:hypothetical protein